jgi:quercetin dioxygenase-like cupin family protein
MMRETHMEVLNKNEIKDENVPAALYKDEPVEVKGVSIRWLSKGDIQAGGAPGYGLRYFTIAPGGEIPRHDHAYAQTMYILSGEFECRQFDRETGDLTDKRICRPGDVVYIPGFEPHGMRNTSSTEPGTFLCCICTSYGTTCA